MIHKTKFLDNPTLAYLDNYLVRTDPESTSAVYYHGTVLALWDDEKPYTFPGVVEVGSIAALDEYFGILVDDQQIILYARPVVPFRIEIVPLGGTPSQPVHIIPVEQCWPEVLAAIIQSTEEQERPEARTRRELIDPVLVQCGWTDGMIRREETFWSKLDGLRRQVDYALYVTPSFATKPVLIAYLEAKHDGLPPGYGLEQARLYAEGRQTQIRWVFSTNGHEFVQFDRKTQQRSGPHPLIEFPSPGSLQRTYNPKLAIDTPILPSASFRRTVQGIDNNDPYVAQAVMENLLDAANRHQCLTVLVQSIQIAHSVGAGIWSLTLGKNGRLIRLNVGKLEVCAFFRNRVHLILDHTALQEKQRYLIEQYALLDQPTAYASVPSSMFCDFSPKHLSLLIPALQPSYESLIRRATTTVKHRTGYYKSHSPGLISYLRTATGISVPDPIYD